MVYKAFYYITLPWWRVMAFLFQDPVGKWNLSNEQCEKEIKKSWSRHPSRFQNLLQSDCEQNSVAWGYRYRPMGQNWENGNKPSNIQSADCWQVTCVIIFFFPALFRDDVHTFIKLFNYFVTFCIPPWDSADPQSDFFLFICIHNSVFVLWHSMSFGKCIGSYIIPDRIVSSPKTPLCFINSTLPPPSHWPSVNHWS